MLSSCEGTAHKTGTGIIAPAKAHRWLQDVWTRRIQTHRIQTNCFLRHAVDVPAIAQFWMPSGSLQRQTLQPTLKRLLRLLRRLKMAMRPTGMPTVGQTVTQMELRAHRLPLLQTCRHQPAQTPMTKEVSHTLCP